MATVRTDLGIIATCPKGDYSSSTEYEYLNEVTYQGSTYRYISSTKSSGHAPTDTTYWECVAHRGDDGVSVQTIEKTSTSGLIDTYTITLSNGNTSTFTVTNGRDGTGSGDMTKSVYDSNNTVSNAGGIVAYVSANAGEDNVQSDWEEDDTTSDAYIQNKPFIPVDIEDLNNVTIASATDGQALIYDDMDNEWKNGALPTVNNGTLTIQVNGTDIQTFTANQSTNATADITVPAVTLEHTGTASTTGVAYQRLAVGNVYAEVDGTKYMETTISISAGSSGSVTFSPSTSGVITSSSAIDVYTSIWGFNPNNVTVGTNTCTVSFPTQSSAISDAKVRIYIK